MKNIDKKLNYIKENYNELKSAVHIMIKKIKKKNRKKLVT